MRIMFFNSSAKVYKNHDNKEWNIFDTLVADSEKNEMEVFMRKNVTSKPQ